MCLIWLGWRHTAIQCKQVLIIYGETKMKQSTAISTPDNLSTDEGILDAKDRLANFQGHDFRPGQLEAVKAVLCSEKKVVAISAPTGTGKSLIGIITGMLHDRFCYLCSTKQLQRQIIVDFPEAR